MQLSKTYIVAYVKFDTDNYSYSYLKNKKFKIQFFFSEHLFNVQQSKAWVFRHDNSITRFIINDKNKPIRWPSFLVAVL